MQNKQRHALEEDEMCSICHLKFDKENHITFCKLNCGTNFHS
jgi:hypothetical protein